MGENKEFLTISWSFSYNSFVKFHGRKIREPQHLARCVIKGLHFSCFCNFYDIYILCCCLSKFLTHTN